MIRRTFISLPLALAARGQSPLPDCYKRVARLTWVVDDVDAVSSAWSRNGARVVGTLPSIEVGGETVKTATALLGNTLIDWAQPLSGDGPLTRFRRASRTPGVFSLIYRIPDPSAFDAEVKRLTAAGAATLSRGKIEFPNVTVEYCYFDTRPKGLYTLGLVMEPEPPLPPPPKDRTISQFALIATEPEKVSAYWASLGFPAFTYSTVNSRDPLYQGKPGVFEMRLGWQRHGAVPFEWIQPLKGPSTYHDHIRRTGEGFHHIAFNVDDMDKAIEEWKGFGYSVSMSGAWGEKDKPGSGRFAYIDTSRDGGIEVELLWNYRAG